MNMKISKKDANLLLMLLGIALFVAVYFAVYQNFQKRADAVQTEISNLTPRLEQLRGYYDNLQTYRDTIEADEKRITEELRHYPAEVRTEDLIMYAVRLEERTGMSLSSASFPAHELLFDFTSVTKDASAAAGYRTVPLSAWRADMGVTGMFTYQALKSALDYIYKETSQRTAVDNVTVSYDAESGLLSGSVAIQKFYIAGETYTYTPTTVPYLPLGNTDPFGTIDLGA